MFVYWLLFGFVTLMCLLHRAGSLEAGIRVVSQRYMIIIFAVFYVAVGGLRHEIGADWNSYLWMYTQISYSSFVNAISHTDPVYGLLNWVSAKLGTGIYLVNSVVCAILITGVVRMAKLTRDPWLAVLIAVPYILIVIGFGYVRQAAAIGLLLIALASLERNRRLSSLLYLLLAIGFHTTSLVIAPLFIVAVSRRIDIYTILFIVLATAAYFLLLEPRLAILEQRYIVSEYQSEGTLVRLLMSALPAALLLLRWRRFGLSGPTRYIWLLVALGSLAILAVYFYVPSSTAVDRIGLYFSIIQIVVFGELLFLLDFKKRDALYLRVFAIALAILVQAVWLTSADHLRYWVPYTSIFAS